MPFRRLLRAVPLGAAALLLASGCSSEQERYCAAVEEHQAELGRAAQRGGAEALLSAREPFRELSERAPDDIADDWDVVTGRIDRFARVLEETGVDPATYSQDDPPEGLGERERADLERAAVGLVEPETQRAMQDLQQHALDVCNTPLSG